MLCFIVSSGEDEKERDKCLETERVNQPRAMCVYKINQLKSKSKRQRVVLMRLHKLHICPNLQVEFVCQPHLPLVNQDSAVIWQLLQPWYIYIFFTKPAWWIQVGYSKISCNLKANCPLKGRDSWLGEKVYNEIFFVILTQFLIP